MAPLVPACSGAGGSEHVSIRRSPGEGHDLTMTRHLPRCASLAHSLMPRPEHPLMPMSAHVMAVKRRGSTRAQSANRGLGELDVARGGQLGSPRRLQAQPRPRPFRRCCRGQGRTTRRRPRRLRAGIRHCPPTPAVATRQACGDDAEGVPMAAHWPNFRHPRICHDPSACPGPAVSELTRGPPRRLGHPVQCHTDTCSGGGPIPFVRNPH
jgi:hypothetical protein